MASGKYCKYCHHFWKNIREYDKHYPGCEYFHIQRRNPQPEMDEHGVKIPSAREMFRCIQDLMHRLDKTEKEVTRLRTLMNARQKRAILEWLNQPQQIPSTSFEKWWREIKAQETDVMKVVTRDLSEGIMSCLESHIRQFASMKAPMRCFTQKPNTFYIYSVENGRTQVDATVEPTPVWRIMSNEQMEKMAAHISQSILREFLVWQKSQRDISECDERAMDKTVNFMMKINGNGVALEKRLVEIKKWVFSKLEENLRVVMECDFE